MDKETFVYVDLDGVPHLMGRLWARVRKNKESATFEYDEGWLKHPARFSLEGKPGKMVSLKWLSTSHQARTVALP